MNLIALILPKVFIVLGLIKNGMGSDEEKPTSLKDLFLFNSSPNRFKRIVVGNTTLDFPLRPLPIGNLSNLQGDAICYHVLKNFYCISQFRGNFIESGQFCASQKMELLYFEGEEEHEYLYNFMSLSEYLTNKRKDLQPGKFLKKSDFISEEDYANYFEQNVSPGLLVKCVSICGHVLPTDEGRILDYKNLEFTGLAVKVEWKTGIVRWYPAVNLQIGGYQSILKHNHHKPAEEITSLEETIFEPGDKVRIRGNVAIGDRQHVPFKETGIISNLDFDGLSSLVFFPSNHGWRGPLKHLEILDKRKAIGTFWTSTKPRFAFTNWAANIEPIVAPKNICIEIRYHQSAKWYTNFCDVLNYFICKSIK